MPLITYTITCTKKELIAPGVYDIRFTKPDGFTFQAGQFVLLDVPLIEKPEDVQTRAFSIASTPSEHEFIFAIKLVPGGRMSRWIVEKLEVGSTMTMKGPFGVFTLNPAVTKPYLFIATGTGIAPFRAHVKWALEEQGDTRPMKLIFGVRNKKDLFWVDEFMGLMKRFPNFEVHTSLTSGEPDWDGHRGRVQEITKLMVTDPANVKVYICGAPDMVADVKKLCLEELKIEKKDLHVEGYI